MSRRKHVLLGLDQEIEPPTANQRIVQIVGPRGGNIVEVTYPDGRATLVMLPKKFNKKLWLKRGGFVMIEEGQTATNEQSQPDNLSALQELTLDERTAQENAAAGNSSNSSNKVTATIIAVLYHQQIKQLKKAGAWPQEYLSSGQDGTSGTQGNEEDEGDSSGQDDDGNEGPEKEDYDSDDLPPLEQNTNRKVIIHYVSDSEDEDDD